MTSPTRLRITDIAKLAEVAPSTVSEVINLYPGDDFQEGVHLAERTFAGEFPGATALYANDQICYGFLQAMHRLGKRCPKDFSILCGSDSPLCEWSMVPITASRKITYPGGAAATEGIIDLLENVRSEEEIRDLFENKMSSDGVIVERSSCRALEHTSKTSKGGAAQK